MTTFQGRRAVQLENETLRVTVLAEGGHIAELLHKPSGVNPLWIPPWRSIEPSTYDPAKHPGYGADAESKLLAGLMGHNVCIDLFGGPTDAEAAAGMTVHGEASLAAYDIRLEAGCLVQAALLPQSQLRFTRRISLGGPATVNFSEEIENLAGWDRPIAWTQHVTLGPPFIVPGSTLFRASATKSKVFESDFTGGKGYMRIGAEFEWPHVPASSGCTVDLRVYPGASVSAGYTTHLMDPRAEEAFFLAWSPQSKLLAGYAWKRADFPWLGVWEENRCRTSPPWNGQTITRGMEFGASPFPETRRQMIDRGGLFGVPAFRWAPARQTIRAGYRAFLTASESIVEKPPG